MQVVNDEKQASVAEAAEFLGVSERTVRRCIDRGELPAYRVGRQVRIDPADLRSYRIRTAVRPTTKPALPHVMDWKAELLSVNYQEPAA